MKERVVMSWSGGKDSAMALHELLREGEYEVVALLTSVSQEFRRISHHGVRESLLDEQAKAIRLPLRKVYLPSGENGGCTNDVYEAIMAKEMAACRDEGIFTIGFGDLFLEDLRAWREANLARSGMKGIFPIWKRETAKLARDVIALEFKACLSSVEERVGADFAAGNTTRRCYETCRRASIRAAKTESFIPSFLMARFFGRRFQWRSARLYCAIACTTRI